MIKAYINAAFMLFASWAVYYSCQGDAFLPLAAAAVVLLTLFFRGKSLEKQYASFEALPLSVLIIGSLIFGFFWRSFVPIPEDASSPFPEFTAALQSGAILASVILWLRPFNKKNMFRLVFCSWLIVGLSINVPFNLDRLIIFSAFCFISIIVVILNTMKRPTNKKYLFSYFRDYVIFSTIIIFVTTGLFFLIARSIIALDSAFLNMMSDFILPRNYTHFLRISPKLNLISPGLSAYDRRPVLELKVPQATAAYLKLQTFDKYDNGTWLEPKKIEKQPLPSIFPSGDRVVKMTMFRSLEDIVPSPTRVTAMRGKAEYFRGSNEIIYTSDEQKTRILEFSISGHKEPIELSEEEYQKYTALPESIELELREIAESITPGMSDPSKVAEELLKYFQNNYQYSLDVNYSADNQGLLDMLRQKRPAYCTYFASAMALLTRAKGIPSRVVAGFLTSEMIDRRNHILIARVRDAHAWTEVLLPAKNPGTDEVFQAWFRFDPTPAGVNSSSVKPPLIDLEQMFEKMWLAGLRFHAVVENVDKEKLKFYTLLFLIAVMMYINRQSLLRSFQRWLSDQKPVRVVRTPVADALRPVYQQYEKYLQKKFGESRQPADTDQEVIDRLKKRPVMDLAAVIKAENFVHVFQASRFGGQKADWQAWLKYFKEQ